MTDDTDPLAAGVPAGTPADVRVRAASTDELAAVLGVLDAAALETDRDRVAASIERGGTLVAVRTADGAATGEGSGDGAATDGDSGDGAATGEDSGDGPVLGALVLVGDRIDGVGVRRRLRGQGIGTALVAAAASRRDRLVATFDRDVRPFYEGLGFAVDEIADGDERYRGEWHRADG